MEIVAKSDYSFLTPDMLLSDNLVPPSYIGQDVRLLYSKSNPSHLGFWKATEIGHARIGLKDLIVSLLGRAPVINDPDNAVAAELIKALPIAYLTTEG